MNLDNLKGKWIYWFRHEDKIHNISKDFVQDQRGDILELNDRTWYTQYPRRILLSEINIARIETREEEKQ